MATAPTTTPKNEMLTREQAAEYLGVQPQTLAVWACNKRQDLPFVKYGRAVRYRRADLDAFIERNLVTTDSD